VKLTFENATIQDAVSKAAKVAPTRGEAFDKAAGLLVTVEDGQVNLRAADNLVFYHEIVDAVEIEGDGEWRIPSVLFGEFMAKLNIGSGKQITLEDEGSKIMAKSGRTRASFRMLDPTYYPVWEPFDVEDMSPITNLGERINMVSWAATTDPNPPLNAIYLDGTHVMATNRICLAVAPCLAPDIDDPIMVPKSAFASLTSHLKETNVAVEGGHMLLMPDDTTQIKVITYGGAYPAVQKIMKRDHAEHVKVTKTEMIEVIERAMVFSGDNRTPLLELYIGEEEVAVFMKDQDQNTLGDVLEVPGSCLHPRAMLEFTPQNILSALRHSPNEHVTIGYDPTKPRTILHVDGGSGYEVWIAARSNAEQKESPTATDEGR